MNYCTPVSRSSVSLPPLCFSTIAVSSEIRRRPSAIRPTHSLEPVSRSREPIHQATVLPPQPYTRAPPSSSTSGHHRSVKVRSPVRRGFPWCWARYGCSRSGIEVCRWCRWVWLAGSGRVFAGTRARRRGRAVAMGVAVEPCAPALPRPVWGPRRAPGVRMLLPWVSVGAAEPQSGWLPCATPWPSHALAF